MLETVSEDFQWVLEALQGDSVTFSGVTEDIMYVTRGPRIFFMFAKAFNEVSEDCYRLSMELWGCFRNFAGS